MKGQRKQPYVSVRCQRGQSRSAVRPTVLCVSYSLLALLGLAFLPGCEPEPEQSTPVLPPVIERLLPAEEVQPSELTIKLKNPLPFTREAAPVTLQLEPAVGKAAVHCGARLDCPPDKNIPFQVDDIDGDGVPDELFFQLDFGVAEERIATFSVAREAERPVFPKKVHAMLLTGPSSRVRAVVESELIAYTLYGPCIVDCIGKVKPNFSAEYFFGKTAHSPHEFSEEYGQDFMPVGLTMGACGIFLSEDKDNRTGTTRPWTEEVVRLSGARHVSANAKISYQLVADGPIRAMVRCRATDWRGRRGTYDVDILYSIAAGQRQCTVDVKFTKIDGVVDDVFFGIGFRKLAEEQVFHYSRSYALAMAENVHDAMAGGVVAKLLGLALIYSPDDFHSNYETKHDGDNHIILFDVMKKGNMRFEICAGWEKDEGIISSHHWGLFARQLAVFLNNPIHAEIEKH